MGKTQDWERNDRRPTKSTVDGLDELTCAHRWRSAWCWRTSLLVFVASGRFDLLKKANGRLHPRLFGAFCLL